MTEWHVEEELDSGLLKIEGALTVANVGQLKQTLLEALDQVDRVTIDLAAVDEIDVAGLQLLCAGHRFAVRQGKQIGLDAGANQRFGQALRDTGFAREVSCDPDKGDRCLWETDA